LVTTDGGVRLFFEVVGSGEPSVVVPNGFYLRDGLASIAHGRGVVFYDARNRGRSESIEDPAQLAAGIHNDVDDLDAVRHHVGVERISIVAHSYMALTAALYAAKYPGRVERLIQIGPIQPNAATQYPPDLTCADDVQARVFAAIGEVQKNPPADPIERCRRFWHALEPLYVADPADAHRLAWDRCDLPNERAFMKYWMGALLPSIQQLTLTRDDFAGATAPALIVHGRKDRSAPYGGGRDWSQLLPNARLLTVDDAGHAPWIERPDLVFGAMRTFLDGSWPSAVVGAFGSGFGSG